MRGYGTSPLELMACDAMLRGLCYLDEFTYSASWVKTTATALGSLATVDVQIQINGDSDFIVQQRNGTVINSQHACEDCPNLLLTIVRAGSGREIMNQAQHWQNIVGGFGSTKFPNYLPMPGLIQRSNILTCRLQNLTTDAPDRVDLSFVGFKVFYTTNAQGQTGDRTAIFHSGV